MYSSCQNPEWFICILYLVIICSDSVSYFLEMRMFIVLVGTLTETRMGVSCITFPAMGPRRGQYAFLMSKSRTLFYAFSTVNHCLRGGVQPLTILKW